MVDLFSRRIVVWFMKTTLDRCLALRLQCWWRSGVEDRRKK